MKDYTKTARLIRHLAAIDGRLRLVETCNTPALGIAKAAGLSGLERLTSGLAELVKTGQCFHWAVVQHCGCKYIESPLIRSLWSAAEPLGILRMGDYHRYWRLVLGIPICGELYSDGNVWSPATVEEILERARRVDHGWRILSEEKMIADACLVPNTVTQQTQQIIDRTREFDSCRAWLLWGPPGGGKTTAARQIAKATAGAWVTLASGAALNSSVWDAVEVLKPRALVIDDLDSVALSGSVSDTLLARLERAHEYAKVIVSTANVLKTEMTNPETGVTQVMRIRGALMRPGRAADFAPVKYDQLDASAMAEQAPHVPPDMRDSRLLAAYLGELEARARAGSIDKADVDEMLSRMQEAGDR